MLMYLETADPDFIDRITNGPHVPKKRVPQEGTTLEHYLDKMKAEMTQEEKLEVLKDATVKNILHNSLDVVMSNRVIACKTSKEIWDTLEVQCQGTIEIKKNRRTLLIQEYERYETNNDKSLIDTYDRILTLLNNLSLARKEYDVEDSNTKFLIS